MNISISENVQNAAENYSGKASHPLNNAFIAGAMWAKNQLYKQSAWNEEDEQQMKSCLEFLDNISCGDDSELNDCRNWLLFIKQRMKGE